jgi:hypothetical protein
LEFRNLEEKHTVGQVDSNFRNKDLRAILSSIQNEEMILTGM